MMKHDQVAAERFAMHEGQVIGDDLVTKLAQAAHELFLARIATAFDVSPRLVEISHSGDGWAAIAETKTRTLLLEFVTTAVAVPARRKYGRGGRRARKRRGLARMRGGHQAHGRPGPIARAWTGWPGQRLPSKSA